MGGGGTPAVDFLNNFILKLQGILNLKSILEVGLLKKCNKIE